MTVPAAPGPVLDADRARAVAVLHDLARAVDCRDDGMRGHSARVADLAESLAAACRWAPGRRLLLREAALVHDVGMIRVPGAILLKPGRLTMDEYERIKEHSAAGAAIVAEVLGPEQVAWVRGHHERHDGGGYPDGLEGDAIPDGARLLALADAWDGMTRTSLYRRPLTEAEALAECRAGSGRQFAPQAVEALCALHGVRPPRRR